MNIDDFKQINDFYELAIDDESLQAFNRLLEQIFDSAKHKIYRLYSDGFTILTLDSSQ
ncbi:MAG: diguanylate cyclase domain-containing protein [Wolinella sp.]